MGTDSRTSAGSMITCRVTDKITPVVDKIFVCRSGSAADTQAVASIAQYYLETYSMLERKKVTVARATQVFRQLFYDNREDLMGSIIVAGWDEVAGGQVLSLLKSFMSSSIVF